MAKLELNAYKEISRVYGVSLNEDFYIRSKEEETDIELRPYVFRFTTDGLKRVAEEKEEAVPEIEDKLLRGELFINSSWTPVLGDVIYYVAGVSGKIKSLTYNPHSFCCIMLFQSGNCFPTKDMAMYQSSNYQQITEGLGKFPDNSIYDFICKKMDEISLEDTDPDNPEVNPDNPNNPDNDENSGNEETGGLDDAPITDEGEEVL